MYKIQRNSFSIILIFIALALIGVFTIPLLKLQRKPSRPLPQLHVSCRWAAATPQTTEQQITAPLEAALSTVKNLSRITSTSTSSTTSITLYLEKEAEMDKTRFEVASIIRRVYAHLPDNVTYPVISFNDADKESTKEPILVYTLYGNKKSSSIKHFTQNEVVNKFNHIDQIKSIEVHGGQQKAFYLEIDQDKMDALAISEQDVMEAVKHYVHRESLGFQLQNQEDITQLPVIIRKPSDTIHWSEIPMINHHNRIVKLTQLCRITEKEVKPQSYFRINGQEAVNVLFYPTLEANYLHLAHDVKKQMAVLQKELPPGLTLKLSLDNTRHIKDELIKIGWRSAFTIIMLLVFVWAISLSFQYLLVILIALTVNILSSFLLFYLFDINIHLYSLAGITISLGLIIDNSIVMIDHLRKHHNKSVYLALLASTLTTIAALFVVWFLPIKLKLILLDFAYVIVINLVVSLAISLWLIPALLEHFSLDHQQKTFFHRKRIIVHFNRQYEKLISFVVSKKKWMAILCILIFGLPVFRLPQQVNHEVFAGKIYNQTIGSSWYQNKAKPIVDNALGGGLRVFMDYVYDGTLFRENEETMLYVRAAMPKGGTLQQLNDVFSTIEQELNQYPEIRSFSTNISGPQRAHLTIRFHEQNQDLFPYQLKAILTHKIIDFGGIEWSVYGVGKGFHNSIGTSEFFDYQSTLRGYNYPELCKQADIFGEILKKNPRTAAINTNITNNWNHDTYDYIYTLKPAFEQIAPNNNILNNLGHYLNRYNQNQQPSIQISTDQGLKNVIIKSQHTNENTLYQLQHDFFKQDSSRLSALVVMQKRRIAPNIYKENQQYLRKIGFKYNGMYKYAHKLQKEAIKELNTQMPIGYSISADGVDFWQQSKTKPYHLLIIIFSMIFIIGAVLFESLRQPFTLLVMILLSFTGVFFTFYWFGFTFDQGGYASFIMLSGLVVNAAIYIINDFNNENPKGIKGYLKAFNHKIIPILLTLTSTILGLIPFILLGEKEPFWFAFSVGTVGGLIFSIPVLCIFLPAFLLKKNSS